MATLDSGAVMLIEIVVASTGALIALWVLKKRTDKKLKNTPAG